MKSMSDCKGSMIRHLNDNAEFSKEVNNSKNILIFAFRRRKTQFTAYAVKRNDLIAETDVNRME